MTVALGLVCSDGVLVASDSMGSDGPIALTAQKVHLFNNTPAIWTMSGSVFVAEEVVADFDQIDKSGAAGKPMGIFTTPDLSAIRSKLHGLVNKRMKTAYGQALGVAPPVPGGQLQLPFATSFLVLGYANSTPWFLEFAYDGSVNWHTDGAGFYATGSGGPFATVASALMKHHLVVERPTLEQGKLIAYRTIDTTIEVSSSSVGPPVQIAICDSSGPALLDQPEIERIATGVERWKALERESLRGLEAGGGAGAEGDLPTMTATG